MTDNIFLQERGDKVEIQTHRLKRKERIWWRAQKAWLRWSMTPASTEAYNWYHLWRQLERAQ